MMQETNSTFGLDVSLSYNHSHFVFDLPSSRLKHPIGQGQPRQDARECRGTAMFYPPCCAIHPASTSRLLTATYGPSDPLQFEPKAAI